LQSGDCFDGLRHFDRLYFEPLTLEDVLAIVEKEKPQGVIVQFGGQTPLNLALELKTQRRTNHWHGSRIDRFGGRPPPFRPVARRIENSSAAQRYPRWFRKKRPAWPAKIGLPVLVRPSYVLGGRAMVIAYDVNTVQDYVAQAH